MFKPDPKKQVVLKFVELFGSDTDPTVVGTRLSPELCRAHGFPRDTFYAQLMIGDEVLATAHSHDWRRAYKLLKLEVEKLYSECGYDQ